MEEKRIDRVIEKMNDMGITNLIVTDPKSILYLTGIYNEPYERLYVLLLKTSHRHVFFLNNLFNINQKELPEVRFSDTDDYLGLLAQSLDDGTVGVDKSWQSRFLIPLMEKKPLSKFILGSECVDSCRACKDEAEIELMKEASEINDAVMLKVKSFIREGVTEKQVSDFITQEYIRLGSTGPSFESIVCFGANAADPHHNCDDTTVRNGDAVLIDIGCCYKGYCSDMTRTYFFKSVSEKNQKIYNIVRTANEKAEAMIASGVALCQVDKTARDYISSFGYGANFNHRLGHFIGQDVHEAGEVSLTSPLIAKEGMIFSIEPGIYLPGETGVRVEDLVLVTKTGCQRLNKVDKDCEIIG